MFKKVAALTTLVLAISTNHAFAGPNYASGKVASLLDNGSDPAIRISSNASPDQCDGGAYGWLYFEGTEEQKYRMYSTAMAMALSKVSVTVYTNTDGGACRIVNIQITSGLE